MDQPVEQIEEKNKISNPDSEPSSLSTTTDIDQLCHLIDENTFGRLQGSDINSNSSSCLSSRFRSVPACQVKAFRSSRLKRLHSSKISSISTNECCPDVISSSESDSTTSHCRSLIPFHNRRRTFSMRFSLSSPSLLTRFRSLSTYSLPQQSRRGSHLSANIRSSHPRYSSSPTTITLFRTQSTLPSIVEEESNVVVNSSSTGQAQLSCTIVDTRRPTATSCNVEELAAYLDNFLYLPKSLSGAAELMYT